VYYSHASDFKPFYVDRVLITLEEGYSERLIGSPRAWELILVGSVEMLFLRRFLETDRHILEYLILNIAL
jgi:hypothetical protein